MQITRRADYAVRTMIDVATVGVAGIAITAEVAARQEIPAPFLAKIVLALTQAGLLRSYRGSGGGISLARPPKQITLLQIVEAVDGPITMNSCVLWPQACGRSGECPAHPVWCEAQAILAGFLSEKSLSDLLSGNGAEERM